MAERRARWRVEVMGLDPRRFVFLDETWAGTNMTRRYGRAPVGQRLVAAVPHGHWKTTTFLSGLRLEGLCAPLVIDGPVDGAIFLAYVRQHLAPALREGDVLVMDNLPAHKVSGVAGAVASAGAALLYLPPYSPDLNPIELVFAKLKGLLRTAAERTVGGLWSALARLTDAFGPGECRNYFRHCGYDATRMWEAH